MVGESDRSVLCGFASGENIDTMKLNLILIENCGQKFFKIILTKLPLKNGAFCKAQ